MRTFAAILTLPLCSCAWLFQDHLPSEYSGHSEPMCSTSNGWAVVDGVFAALNVVSGITASSDNSIPQESKSAYVAGGIVGGLIHTVSAITGAGWASSCRDARASWDSSERQQAISDAEKAKREALEYEVKRNEQRDAAARIPPPRGFYCAIGGDTGFCVRAKAECERTRATVAPDLAACALTERAWCFTGLCFPSVDLCEDRRTRMQSKDACMGAE